MSESIIREGVQRLGISPGDPDYLPLVTLLRNMVNDLKAGRLALDQVDLFFEENRGAVELLIKSKGLSVSVDDAVKILSDTVKFAYASTSSTLLSSYAKFRWGAGSSREKEGKKEAGSII